MKEYEFIRIETIKSIQIIQAESQEQAEKQLENFLGSDHTNKDELLDEIISILNKEVDIDEYVQDVNDYCKSNK